MDDFRAVLTVFYCPGTGTHGQSFGRTGDGPRRLISFLIPLIFGHGGFQLLRAPRSPLDAGVSAHTCLCFLLAQFRVTLGLEGVRRKFETEVAQSCLFRTYSERCGSREASNGGLSRFEDCAGVSGSPIHCVLKLPFSLRVFRWVL